MSATNKQASSLLAHLATRLTDRTENLATEALGYILNNSVAARAALRELVSTGDDDGDVGEILRAETEVKGEEDERVDLVGFDAQGSERVLIEAKFWAGLTDHQPKTYLKRMTGAAGDQPSVLLFVAPERRLETLWVEVCKRVPDMLAEDQPASHVHSHSVHVKDSRHRMLLLSWTRLLDAMLSRANQIGEFASEGDLRQLLALCNREDVDAFLPLRSSELGPDVPRLLRNLRRLVDDATERAREKGFADTTGLKVTPQTYGYGRYIRLGNAESGWAEAWFGVNYNRWVTGESPIWVQFVESKDSPHMSLHDVDGKLQSRNFYIPLPTGVEYKSVCDEVVKSLGWLAEGLG